MSVHDLSGNGQVQNVGGGPSIETAPSSRCFAITPDDDVDLVRLAPRIYVGGAGNVRLISSGGDTVTFTMLAGSYIDVQATRVLATGTTATGLVGLG